MRTEKNKGLDGTSAVAERPGRTYVDKTKREQSVACIVIQARKYARFYMHAIIRPKYFVDSFSADTFTVEASQTTQDACAECKSWCASVRLTPAGRPCTVCMKCT